jgi:hypothetical protein
MIVRPSLRSLLLAALATVSATSAAAAQTVRATATDASTGAPVAEALVRVESADGTLVAAGFTAGNGVVVLRVRGAGTYRVQARRAGYRDETVAGLVLGGADEMPVALRMAQRPFAIDTLVVIGRSEDERGRDAFERRRAMNEGVFLDSAYLEPRSGTAPFVGDMLRGVPGIYLRRYSISETFVRSERGWRCMVLLVDGRPLQLSFLDGGRRELHHAIGPRDVKAVEVYREFSEVPREFHRYVDRAGGNCGAILYWTRAGW